MTNDSLGDRMKGYEHVSRQKLIARTPVIIRIDGKAFHTWTKCLKGIDPSLTEDPFSEVMAKLMAYTTDQLVRNIQNAVLGYTQSDEISILLNDWKTLTTDRWFGNSVQKMASVASSMSTAYFNKAYDEHIGSLPDTLAMFDARVFNVPKEEVANYFVWRQQDATRNSVQMLGRHYFSHKQMNNKSVGAVQDMLMNEHTINWNDIDTWKKRGTCVVRGGFTHMKDHNLERGADMIVPHQRIELDREIPIFTQDRAYIEDKLKAVST